MTGFKYLNKQKNELFKRKLQIGNTLINLSGELKSLLKDFDVNNERILQLESQIKRLREDFDICNLEISYIDIQIKQKSQNVQKNTSTVANKKSKSKLQNNGKRKDLKNNTSNGYDKALHGPVYRARYKRGKTVVS